MRLDFRIKHILILNGCTRIMYILISNILSHFPYTQYFVIFQIFSVIIVMSCDAVEKSVEKFITTCYILPTARSPLRAELHNLANYAEKLRPTFSAAGFYQMNQMTLTRILTVVTTYTIISIQFNT